MHQNSIAARSTFHFHPSPTSVRNCVKIVTQQTL